MVRKHKKKFSNLISRLLEKIKSINLTSISRILRVLVYLFVGAGMANKVFTLETLLIPSIVTVIAGWIILIGTILGVVISLFR